MYCYSGSFVSAVYFINRVVRELTLGRRISFYKVRGEIGCGNFSHVKLGIHALTKGKEDTCQAGNTLTDI